MSRLDVIIHHFAKLCTATFVLLPKLVIVYFSSFLEW